MEAFCKLPWSRAKIHCDGTVNMCCHQTWSRLGDLFENTFDEIWFGDLAEEIRKDTLKGKMHPLCQTQECPFTFKDKKVEEFYVNKNGYPIELEFDIHSSHCNFGGKSANPKSTCIMCPRATEAVRNMIKELPDRTDELAEKIAHVVPNLTYLSVMGLAEIFWEDKLFEILDKLDFISHRNHIFFWSNTNGSLFDEARQKRYSEYVKRGLLHFSIDAATPETFYKIRQNHVFDRILHNLEAWSSLRNELNEKPGVYHDLKIYNNINSINVHEVPDMVRMAHKYGVGLTLTATHDSDNQNSKISEILPNESNYEIFADAERKARELAKELGVYLIIDRPLDIGFSKKKEKELVQITLA